MLLLFRKWSLWSIKSGWYHKWRKSISDFKNSKRLPINLKINWKSCKKFIKMLPLIIIFKIILATGRGILADFWVPHEIESWNFQHMILIYNFLKPLKIWAHLDNFYFHCFMGDQKENSKSLPRLSSVFLNFSLWSPYETMKIKVV